MVVGIVGPITTANAADPITTEAAPTLTGPPSSGSTPVKDIVLSWDNNAPHATAFQVQMSPNGDWTNNTVSLPDSGRTVNTVYEVPISLPHAAYFWRVRAVDANGSTPWSSARTVLHEWSTPFNILQSPTNADPTVAWQPVAGASVYRVRFSQQPDFTGDDTHTCWTANTTFTPYNTNMAGAEGLSLPCFSTSDLRDNTDYFWDVVAFDDSTAASISADTANDSGWDCPSAQPECDTYFPVEIAGLSTFHFQGPRADTTQPKTPPTGLSTTWHAAALPATACDATNDCPTTPTFSWNAVPGANIYEVHVWRDPARSNTYRVYQTSATSLTPRDNFFDAQAGTPYFWSVAAGWCRQSPTKPFCATSKAKDPVSPDCPAAATGGTAPTADTLAVSPAGPHGAQSIAGGDTATVTLTGTNIVAGACVKASAGIITDIQVTAPTSVSFTYIAPNESSDPVLFNIVNPDGETSADSPPLEVVGTLQQKVFGNLAAPVSFAKTSDAVPLNGPANTASLNGAQNLTFSWQRYLPTAGQGAYDVRNYHLQIARDVNFDNVVWDVDSIDFNRFTNPSSQLGDGLWYWRVQGIDESGNPLTWSSTRSFNLDSTAPVFRLTDASPIAVTAPLHVSVSDAALQGTVSQSTLHVVPVVGGGGAVPGNWKQTSATTWTFTPSVVLVPGQSYALAVVPGTIGDQAGNDAVASSRSVRTSGRADDNNKAWHYGSGWKQVSASGALGGTFHRGIAGATATVHLVGKTLSVYACKAPHSGRLRIGVDGTTVASPSLKQSFTKCGLLVYRGSVSTSSAHTLRVTAVNGPVELDRATIS